ncbi:MAG: hypothetical protein U0869_08815 [Chloroflexota bacterium]
MHGPISLQPARPATRTPAPRTPATPGSASDPASALRSLKRLTLGVTVLATAAIAGLVGLHGGAAGSDAGATAVLQDAGPAAPVVTAQDPFFDRTVAQGGRVRRAVAMPFLRSSGS